MCNWPMAWTPTSPEPVLGAVVLQEPEDQFYGDRTYRVLDPEGHMWTFAQHVRDVSRAEAETAIGQPITATAWA